MHLFAQQSSYFLRRSVNQFKWHKIHLRSCLSGLNTWILIPMSDAIHCIGGAHCENHALIMKPEAKKHAKVYPTKYFDNHLPPLLESLPTFSVWQALMCATKSQTVIQPNPKREIASSIQWFISKKSGFTSMPQPNGESEGAQTKACNGMYPYPLEILSCCKHLTQSSPYQKSNPTHWPAYAA